MQLAIGGGNTGNGLGKWEVFYGEMPMGWDYSALRTMDMDSMSFKIANKHVKKLITR